MPTSLERHHQPGERHSRGSSCRRGRWPRQLAALLRRVAVPASLISGVIFVIASLQGGHLLYAASLLIFSVGLMGFLARPAPHPVRWPLLFQAALGFAIAAALADGFLDLANAVGTATNITTVGIVVGVALAFIGRRRFPARP